MTKKTSPRVANAYYPEHLEFFGDYRERIEDALIKAIELKGGD